MTKMDPWMDAKEAFGRLCETIAALRHPTTGCPWDLEQTHASLRRYMIEEAYEAADVMDPARPDKMREELGDVLLQVVLNSQLALDAGTFNISDVISGLDAKMRRRHPHVFGESESNYTPQHQDKSKIRAKWEEIKSKENAASGEAKSGVFASIKAGQVTPASRHAVAIGKIARRIAFDWSDPQEVLRQVESEIAELRHEIINSKNPAKIHEEMGDVFFSLGQLCRHLEIDPEICAIDGNKKFLTRFESLERLAIDEGIDIESAGTETGGIMAAGQKPRTGKTRKRKAPP